MSEIVSSLWIGTRLSLMQQLCIRSFLANGHPFRLYVFDEVDNVPEGTVVCDAAAILSRESIFCYQHGFGKGSFSAFSNLFRYALIHRTGGWWVDTDVICLKPLIFDGEYIFPSEREEDRTVHAATCVFRSPAGAPYLDYCIRVCDAKNKSELRWSEIGPDLFDEAITRFGLTEHVRPVHVFNPVDYFEFAQVLAPHFEMSRLEGSYTIHLWNQMWKNNNVSPDAESHPGSLLTFLKNRYLPSAVRGV